MAIEEYRDDQGNIRMLARPEPNDDHRKMRAGMMSLTAYVESVGEKLMDESQYVDVDLSSEFGAEFGVNQQSSNGCTGFASVGALMEARAQQGMPFQELSGAYLYSQINGGRDAGSVITDAATQLLNGGTCLRSQFDIPKVFANQASPECRTTAQRFRANVIVTVWTWAEICHAMQKRWKVIVPLCVGAPYERFSNEGVAGYTPGGGNHAVRINGMKRLSDGWNLMSRQTWYPTWGPFKNGYYYVSRKAIEGAGYPQDGYAIVDVVYDPQGDLPPAPGT